MATEQYRQTLLYEAFAPAESTVLTNKDDPHAIKLFDLSIKGGTYRFEKL